MDLVKILSILHAERERIISAIDAVERLTKVETMASPKKRGRPPGSKNKPKLEATN
jgi:hypothetical protein